MLMMLLLLDADFNSTNMNIIEKTLSSNEAITCDDQDCPWMNSFVKSHIRAKDNFSKKDV